MWACTSVDVLQSCDDADDVVVEVWDTREQCQEYLAWQRQRGTSDRLREALAEAPVIRHFDETDA